MQVGIFNCLFIFVIAALNDYIIVASIIVIAIRNLINCAALVGMLRSIGRRSVSADHHIYNLIGTRTFGRSHVPIAI